MNDSQFDGETKNGKHTAKDPESHVQQEFLRNAPAIRNFLHSLQPEFAEAEDLFQDIFLVVTDKARHYKEGTNFLGWVFTIARFKIIERNRKTQRRQKLLSSEVAEVLLKDAPEVQSELLQIKINAMQNCMKILAPNARAIVNMRYFENLKPSEIAKKMNMEVNKIYLVLTRSRSLLRKCVSNQITGKDCEK